MRRDERWIKPDPPFFLRSDRVSHPAAPWYHPHAPAWKSRSRFRSAALRVARLQPCSLKGSSMNIYASPRSGLLIAFCCVLAIVASGVQPRRTTAQATPTSFPADALPNVKDWGAKGDGVTDDTAAIQAALHAERVASDGSSLHDDYYGRPKALYFPAGTYLVSNTLRWIGCCVLLQGQGPGSTTIRLKDNAAGFGDPGSPRPVITMPDGNMSFRQNISDLTINTGRGNAGAIGIDYIANNTGAIRNVAVVSGDGTGRSGIDMTRSWPGPLLLKQVTIDGFDVGIRVAHAEYGPTLEGITLRNQRVAGIDNDGNTLALRQISSTNSVPAIVNRPARGAIVVLDSTFSGGAAGASAIDSQGYVYARNISASGYTSAIRERGATVPGLTQREYTSDAFHILFPSPQRMLNLPVQETPRYHDADPAAWAAFKPRWYGDTAGLQALLDSGKSTIYFPFAAYFAYNEAAVTVPPTVKRIIGFSSVVNGDSRGINGGGIRLIVDQPSSEPLIVEQWGYGVTVDQRSSRPVAIKHGAFRYRSTAGAGDLFLEDVVIGPVRVQPGQRVWARQFNNEAGGTKITNDGGRLWILGLKTEVTGTVIETINRGETELLGTLIYPAAPFDTPEKQSRAAFINCESSMSLIYSQSSYCAGCAYPIQVEETRGGVTRQWRGSNPSLLAGRIGLISSFQPGVINLQRRAYVPFVRR
jgi:hypothetical protein